MASYGNSVIQEYSHFWRGMRTFLPGLNVLTRYGSYRRPRRSLRWSMLKLISQIVYITASEVLWTCDKDKMSWMILSSCILIISTRPWSWLGKKILRSNQLVKISGYQASFKEKHVQIDEMKLTWFLWSAHQNTYSFMLKKLRNRDNMGRDAYHIMTAL